MSKLKRVCIGILSIVMAITIIGVCGSFGTKVKASEKLTSGGYEYVRGTSLDLNSNNQMEVSRIQVGDIPMGKEDSWTLFVYMCGSDLESQYQAATADIKEMISASESDNVNIIIQTGGSYAWNKPSIDPEKIGRYIIKGNKLELIESHPDANMGDVDTLKRFLTWGVKEYPAEHMGVILWNHGGGTLGGVCFDEKHNYDSLLLAEMEKAFDETAKYMTDKFEVIGFDACLMGSIETANVIAPYADYMIGSEESEVGDGWEYTSIVNGLVNNPDMNGYDLGKIACDAFMASIEDTIEEEKATLSVLDLNKVDEVIVKFNEVAKEIDEKSLSVDDIANYFNAAKDADDFGGNDDEYGYTFMVDLADFMHYMSKYVGGTKDVINAVKDMVVYEKAGSFYPFAEGVSIYYPYIDCGMIDMNILRNVVISPYYMNYIDKVAYSTQYETLEGFKSNSWEKNSYYFEKDYLFLDYMFYSKEDYINKLKNEVYYTQADFDDKWNVWYGKNK